MGFVDIQCGAVVAIADAANAAGCQTGVNRPSGARRGQQAQASIGCLLIIGVANDAARTIEQVDIAVMRLRIDGGTNGNLVGQGHIDHTEQMPGIVVASFRGGGSFELLGGGIGDGIDRAAGGALAVERTLWPAQYLDARQVEEA